MIFGSRRIKHEIDPDEIFLDSSNVPLFDNQQFEGRLERPISKIAVFVLAGVFFIVFSVFASKVFMLQIVYGNSFKGKSENNRLEQIPIFGDRGVIYDRNKVKLAWNRETPEEQDFYFRDYKNMDGLGHLLGYVTHPRKDNKGVYWQKEVYGREGIELEYDSALRGENGLNLIEIDATGVVTSESLQKPKVNGENIVLSIDARVQEKFYDIIRDLALQVGFRSGAGILIDVNTGEIISMVSFPEYNSSLLSDGSDTATIKALLKDTRKPFLNRAVSGLYTPGSIVKPYFAIGALVEKIITPEKQILSTGSISIPNPYSPDKESVFKDWKAHGLVDMRRAIAVSSDVYFYAIGGGYKDQVGLGIKNIDKYARIFGIGEKTGIDLPGEVDGVIPDPAWKAKNFNGEEWFLGNTYHTAIGQYGFQVTPIQMARAVSALANEGFLVKPHLLKDTPVEREEIDIDKEFFKIAKEGMRAGVNEGGTAQGLNMSGLTVAAKTGTAELGVNKDFVNSWTTGFFPYENPRYAFVVVMEHGPKGNTTGGVYVIRNLLDWLVVNTPEYIK